MAQYKKILTNTILKYPLYMKKQILKQLIDEGLIINSKNTPLTFDDIVDVSDDLTIDDKIVHVMNTERLLGYIEEYEYKKQYRHFCYFRFTDMKNDIINALIESNELIVCDKKEHRRVDSFKKYTINILEDIIYIKFSKVLDSDTNDKIKFPILAIIDPKNKLVELRFDRVGIAYKNSYNFYKDKIDEVKVYFKEKLDIDLIDIDFKAIIDYIKSFKEDATVYAQRMQRNGTTAYLEAYADDTCVMPILGEIVEFIEQRVELFDIDNNTKTIKNEILAFLKGIEIKSDLPVVKVKLDTEDIKFGITHEYKGANYSLFMLYGDLDKERLKYVREYIIKCHIELEQQISINKAPGDEM